MEINKKIMIIGIPKEIQEDESRVAISPEIVKKYLLLDHKIIIEKDSGKKSLISDENFSRKLSSLVRFITLYFSPTFFIISLCLTK